MTKLEREALSRLFYHDWLKEAFDPIELAQMEWKKNGGKVKVLNYRPSRKEERLVRVGVKN